MAFKVARPEPLFPAAFHFPQQFPEGLLGFQPPSHPGQAAGVVGGAGFLKDSEPRSERASREGMERGQSPAFPGNACLAPSPLSRVPCLPPASPSRFLFPPEPGRSGPLSRGGWPRASVELQRGEQAGYPSRQEAWRFAWLSGFRVELIAFRLLSPNGAFPWLWGMLGP